MNKYYVQGELGIHRTIRARTKDNARLRFLRDMKAEYPDLFEFIQDNVDVTCIHHDGTNEDEELGWTDEVKRRHI